MLCHCAGRLDRNQHLFTYIRCQKCRPNIDWREATLKLSLSQHKMPAKIPPNYGIKERNGTEAQVSTEAQLINLSSCRMVRRAGESGPSTALLSEPELKG
jgi:hypothetical protein